MAKLSDIKLNTYGDETIGDNREQNTGSKLEYIGSKFGEGLVRSVEGLSDFIVGGSSFLAGKISGDEGLSEWGKERFMTDWFDYSQADRDFNPSAGWQLAGNVASGVGNSMLSLGTAGLASSTLSAAGHALSTNAIRAISLTTLGLSAAGNATGEAAKKTGELGAREFLYGALSGAVEVGTEAVGDWLGVGSGRVLKGISNKFASDSVKAVTRSSAGSIMKGLAGDFLDEALEEGLSAIADPWISRWTGVDPNAEVWNWGEIGYEALIGGLSGVVMGSSQRNIHGVSNLYAGSKAVSDGKASAVISAAQSILKNGSKYGIDEDIMKNLQSAYDALQISMKKTNGEVSTIRQKELLGVLSKNNMAALVQPFIQREAVNIVLNAEETAKQYSAFLTDENGNKINLTADAITNGVTIDTSNPDAMAASIRSALKNNQVLAGLAIMSFAGKVNMQRDAWVKYNAENPGAVTQDTLNQFIEQATNEEKAELGRVLGVDNWNTATADDVNEAFRKNADTILKAVDSANAAKETAKGETVSAPKRFTKATKDGAYDIGDGYVVVKQGDAYRVYNGARDSVTRELSARDVNALMNQKVQETAQNEENETVARADEVARRVVPDYDKLSESVKRSVRMTIRQAAEYKVSTADMELSAKLSAKSGLNIVFSRDALALNKRDSKGNLLYANGQYNMRNTIYLNPDLSQIGKTGNIMLHELGHWLFNNGANKMAMLNYATAALEDSKYNKVVQQYVDFYKSIGETEEQYAEKVFDEIQAAYAEELMTDDDFWNKLLADDPKLNRRVPAFMRKWADRMDMKQAKTAAEAYSKIYQDAFRRLSSLNQGSNAFEYSKKKDGSTEFRMSLASYFASGRKDLYKYLVNQYGKDDAKQTIEAFDDIARVAQNMIKNNPDLQLFSNWSDTNIEFDENGHPIFSTSVKNGEYELNQDFSRVCKKRRHLDMVLNYLATNDNFRAENLKKSDFLKINRAIKAHGFEIACDLCFVDAKRYRQAEWAKTFTETYNDILKSVIVGDTSNFDFINGVMPSDDGVQIDPNKPVTFRKWEEGRVKETVHYDSLDDLIKNEGNANDVNIAKLIRDNPELRHWFVAKDIISSNGFDNIQRANQKLRGILDGWGGSSVPKPSAGDTVYDNSVLLQGKYKPETAFAMGGMRMNSFSDFMAHMFFDYCQAFADAEAKGLPIQAYTKELLFIRLYGKTGGKFNMSGIPAVMEGLSEKNEAQSAGLDIRRLAEHLGKDINEVTEQEILDNLDYCDYVWAKESINMDNAILLQSGILYDRLTSTQKRKALNAIREGNFDQAFAIAGEENVDRDYAKHCGTIVVGVSKAHILKLLRDNTIRMVIPYHKSGLNPEIAKLMHISAYADYTKKQNTSSLKKGKDEAISLTSKKIPAKYKIKDFDFYEFFGKTIDGVLYDGKRTAQAYLDWCDKGRFDKTLNKYVYDLTDGGLITADELHKEYRVVPKFEEFRREENYYKVLEDFDVYDTITNKHSPQEAIHFLQNGSALPEDYKKILLDALKAEQKDITDFEDELYNNVNGLQDEIMKISKKAFVASEATEQRYSLPETDSDGNRLTDKQREFFKDSKAVDENGKLMPMYHHTENRFTEFDINKARRSMDIQGFYFYPDNESGEEYGSRSYAVYLNLTNPYVVRNAKDAEKVAIDYRVDDGGVRVREQLESEGYDGVIFTEEYFGTTAEYIAFRPEQIKDTFNKTPTENPDMRYSLTEEEINGIIEQAKSNVEGIFNEIAIRQGISTTTGENASRSRRGYDANSYASENGYADVHTIAGLRQLCESGEQGVSVALRDDICREMVSGIFTKVGRLTLDERMIYRAVVRAVEGTSDFTYNSIWHEVVFPRCYTAEMLTTREINNKLGISTGYYFGYPVKRGWRDEIIYNLGYAKPGEKAIFIRADQETADGVVQTIPDVATVEAGSPSLTGRHERMHILAKLTENSSSDLIGSITKMKLASHGLGTSIKGFSKTMDTLLGYIVLRWGDRGDAYNYNEEIMAELYAGTMKLFDKKAQAYIDKLVANIDKAIDNEPVNDMRFSLPSDADYMKAVEDGEMETAQKMVREAATAAGYDSPKLYHGTRFFGFTEFKDNSHETPFIYTSTDRTVSAHYAGDNNYAFVRDIGKGYKGGDSIKDIISDAETVYGTKYHVATAEEKQTAISKVLEDAKKIEGRLEPSNIRPDDLPNNVFNAMDVVEALFYDFVAEYGEDDRQEYVNALKWDAERYEDAKRTISEYLDENGDKLDERFKNYLRFLRGFEAGDAAIDIIYRALKILENDNILVNEAGNYNVPSKLRKEMETTHNIGAYQLYGNLGSNPFVFDANGAQFWGIKVPQISDEYMGTDSIVKWARENGYTSVVMKNIYDYGDKADNYVFFKSSQLKSADPITYDDQGNVIPLSKRFNEQNEDIRYSIPDVEYMQAIEDADNDKAREILDEQAKKAGYTLLATHRTDADFTVFDKGSRSGRNGKTLGDAFYVAKTQKEWEGTPIHTMYDTDTYGKNRMLLYVNPGKTLDLKNGLSESEANRVYDKYFAPFHEDKFGIYRPHVIDKLQEPSRLVDYIEEAAKNLDTTTDEVFKWLGYNSVKDGIQYALFDANQMKSADLVTYDDNEKIIPPSERFNQNNDDIRWSLPSDDLKEAKRIKKLAEQQSERATERLQKSRKLVQDNTAANKATNRVLDLAQKLKEYVTKRKYVSSSVLANPLLDAWAKELGKLKYRSDIRKASARKIIAGFSQFYNANNDVLTDYYNSLDREIDANVLGALELIKKNMADPDVNYKPLTLEELQAAEIVLGAADALFRNFDTVRIEGKRQLTQDVANFALEVLRRVPPRDVAKVNKLMQAIENYFLYSTDPRTVFRMLDHYDPDGVLTKMFNEIVNGETKANYQYVEFMQPFEDFIKTHKNYKKRYQEATIKLSTANGKEIELPLRKALVVYELLKRKQAQRGLLEAGINYRLDNGYKVDEMLSSVTATSEKELEKWASSYAEQLASKFTAEDKELISITEDFFNNKSKAVKSEADIEQFGYTNALEDFYFPIKRDETTRAKNLTDAQALWSDIAEANTYSFNKNTIQGARNQLFIGDLLDIVQNHARMMAQYAYMGQAMQSFNRVYNRNVGTSTEVTTIRKYLDEHVWKDSGKYIEKLFSDIYGVQKPDIGDKLFSRLRGAFATYQLGMNVKVIATQLASIPTATMYLSPSSIGKAIVHKVNFKELDNYSQWAMVRHHNQEVVKAEGVIDKIGKIGEVTTKPIQWTDRLAIGILWNACQYEVAKNKGLAFGTEENKIEAAKLLEQVGRETQPNYTNTERSQMMRSRSEFIRTLTMFTSVPLKLESRLVDAAGHMYFAQKSHDKVKIRSAGRRLRKVLAAIFAANVMYALMSALVYFGINKERKNKDGSVKTIPENFFDELASVSIGMFPVIKNVYDSVSTGYDITGFNFDMVNDILDSSNEIKDTMAKAFSGQGMVMSDITAPLRSLGYSVAQITGVPARNFINLIKGTVKRVSPETVYTVDSWFTDKNYRSDLAKYTENEKMATLLLDLYTKETTGTMSNEAKQTLLNLYTQGYDVLPKSIGNKISYSYTDENGDTQTESFTLNAQQKKQFKAIYSEATPVIEAMLDSKAFQKLSEENQAKAIRSVNNAYYIKAKNAVTDTETANSLLMYFPKDTGKYATILAGLSDVTADTDKKGNVINGTKKQNVYKYLTSNGLTKNEALYVMAVKGYSLKNLPVSEANARKMLLKYILSLPVSQSEKAAIAEHCGFTVKGNRIISKNG